MSALGILHEFNKSLRIRAIDCDTMNKERTIEYNSNHVHSKSLRATTSTALFRLLCALFPISGHYASADDISAITPVQHKPNVLLVLDYSQSMDKLLNGEVKIDSLRTAVHGVIDQFSSEINIGIGSLFRQEAGGIIWPVSDLSQPANFVDPRITDLSITCLLYTSPSPRDKRQSRMPSSA